MKTTIYTNKMTNETCRISGESINLERAWNLGAFVCKKMGWNVNAFCMDVKVRVQ